MRKIVWVLWMLPVFSFSYAQNNKLDSLNRLIAKASSDTQRINLEIKKIKTLSNNNQDSSILFGKRIIEKSKIIQYKLGEAKARIAIAFPYCFKGEYNAAKENLDISNEILSVAKDSPTLADMYDSYGIMYSMQAKYDSSFKFYQKALDIATLNNYKHELGNISQNMAIAYQQISNYPKALDFYQKSLTISEQENDLEGQAYTALNIAITINSMEDYARAEQSYLKAVSLARKLDIKIVLAYAYSNLSSLYGEMNKIDEEYDYGMKAAIMGKEMGDQGIESSSLSRAASALAKHGKFQDAEKLSRQSISVADSSGQPLNIYQTYSTMGTILKMENKFSKAIPYFEKAFHSLTDADLYVAEVGESYSNLSDCYEKTGDYKKSLATYKISSKIVDSIRGRENIRKATEQTMNYEFERKQQVAKVEQQKQNDLAKTKQTALIVGLILTLILAAVAFNGFKNKRKANFLLQKQKKEIQDTLSNLKLTQAQLIQSEKMASLGELTAGIAHEIQNPLNFVNNFSEINTELIEELKEETRKGNTEGVMALANNIQVNDEKISHHGKRADSIVKSMLLHSQSSSGKKEPTDINALADEYLRLAYHGIRAKDNTFNVKMVTDYDQTIGQIIINPQDIGRVLLNLFNNAFYAVAMKIKQVENFKPAISVITRKVENRIEISVKDNGYGIPSKIMDKIFQPFFTTKPAGQGTGLGLSLSYDILKAHGGEIMVDTKEGDFTEFVIRIPIGLS
jgi:two-component system, NtrC family, sensor kinase